MNKLSIFHRYFDLIYNIMYALTSLIVSTLWIKVNQKQLQTDKLAITQDKFGERSSTFN